MSSKKALLLLPLVTLAACAPLTPVTPAGQFWQRASMSEAIYAQGPKAQQMLHRDIARCVTELKELERLNMTKNSIKTDGFGRVMTSDEFPGAFKNTQERDEHLLNEPHDYLDFESCMADKGWERVAHTPYDVARKGFENYDAANVRRQSVPESTVSDGNAHAGKLNE